MNPKNLSHLDPQLKEAYERVMGTSVPVSNSVNTTPAFIPQASPVKPQVQNQVVVNKKKEGLSPILVGVAVILFFAAYTIIWVKVFNLKIPFIPQF